MMSQEDKSYQNEYRTGGPMRHRSSGAFAVGLFVFFAVTGMFLTACLLSLRIHNLATHKVIATLDTTDETQNIQSDLYMEGLVTDCTELGFTYQTISPFCEKYYELPEGIYIVRVEKHTPAARHGVLPGDILIKANGVALRFPATLQSIIEQCPKGASVELEFIRKGKTYTAHLTPGG